MPSYAAFLRAVNVSGRTIRMERLREIFRSLGFDAVETFIASGNVVFDARQTRMASLEPRIEAALEEGLGYAVGAFVRRVRDLQGIADHQPFPVDASGSPGGPMYVGFLRTAPDAARRRDILALGTDVDAFDVKGSEVYWLVRGTLHGSQVAAPAMARALGPVTMRNRNTVARMARKYANRA